MSKNEPLTPSDLVRTLSNTNVQGLDAALLRVRGVYCAGQRADPYGDGYFYDKLKDELSDNVMVLKVPKAWRKDLQNNAVYDLEGTLDRKTVNNNELGIFLAFRLTRIVGKEAPLVDERLREAAEILTLRRARPRRNVPQLIRDCFKERRKPRVALVGPSQGQTEADVERALEGQRQNYEIDKVRVGMANAAEIVSRLLDLDGRYDLIAVYRGGGTGWETFNDNGIARAVVGMETPLVTGIGHATDNPFVEMVADQALATPTALGDFLKRCAEESVKDLSWLEAYRQERAQLQQAVKALQEEKGGREMKHQQELAALMRERNELQTELKGLYREGGADALAGAHSWARAAAWVAAGVVLGLAIGLAVAYFYAASNRSAAREVPAEVTPGPEQQAQPTTPAQSNNVKGGSRKRK